MREERNKRGVQRRCIRKEGKKKRNKYERRKKWERGMKERQMKGGEGVNKQIREERNGRGV